MLPAVVVTTAGVVLVLAVGALLAGRCRRPLAGPPAAAVPAGPPVGEFADSALPLDRRPDPYESLPDGHLLAPAPKVGGSSVVLAEWLRHHSGRDGVWQEVVAEFYGRAARVPVVADYFTGVDLPVLQRHFVAALVIVTGRGLTAGTVRRLAAKHTNVRNSAGAPITPAIFDAVVSTLAGVLDDYGVPPATIREITALVAPLRVVIATDPDRAIQ